MQVRDVLDYRETKTAAFNGTVVPVTPDAVETIENPADILQRDSRAVVFDAEPHAEIAAIDVNSDVGAGRRVLARVQNQIAQEDNQ